MSEMMKPARIRNLSGTVGIVAAVPRDKKETWRKVRQVLHSGRRLPVDNVPLVRLDIHLGRHLGMSARVPDGLLRRRGRECAIAARVECRVAGIWQTGVNVLLRHRR